MSCSVNCALGSKRKRSIYDLIAKRKCLYVMLIIITLTLRSKQTVCISYFIKSLFIKVLKSSLYGYQFKLY